MSNDNKTLADVQPGGRVRLGDQAERARFEEWYVQNAFDYVANPIGSRDCALMRKAWNAALSAQPSPGGQGEALHDAVGRIFGCDGSPWRTRDVAAVLRDYAALAARQPVGEPITVEAVAEIFNHPEYGLSIDWLLENGIGELQVGDVLMVSDRAITDEDGSGEVYTAPPAQATDLGQFREAVVHWYADADNANTNPAWVREESTRLLALIDSKAAGNA